MQAQRRTVFKLAGGGVVAAGAAGLLSGCGTDMYGGGARPRTRNNRQLRVKKSEIPVGSGVIYPDQGYVVTQPVAGTFEAFSDICPHQGCPVRQITADNKIHCLCHNSYFSVADGSRIEGPAPTGLERAHVQDSGEELVVTALKG
ncbi:Ferredoxin subunit of nitrite reductase or a ring-hydroxylating dioxygenase [Raineyella antarctica]|uniref:Cytochrome bc1 complex Rieske iron-sulfur subunit n=1 Tax=Raineyella antarctica TaxID=1577474 RepID=A0A1G6GED1_9ACTN|nr:Rieske (2Fe-2S) protein [Raineyella antarctica]SDB80183.1 Ferredoxin subunit of nitrite reductase or a ring-hydroxylating dioxygenase [Raineyella antarctica]